MDVTLRHVGIYHIVPMKKPNANRSALLNSFKSVV